MVRHRDLHLQRRRQIAALIRHFVQRDYMLATGPSADGNVLLEAAGWLDPLGEGKLPDKEKPESDLSARAVVSGHQD